jgi:hypothetical protein
MPGGELVYIAKVAEPPIERGQYVEGWLYLTWDDAFDMWNNNGVELCAAEIDVKDTTQFVIREGTGALVASKGEWMETKFSAIEGEIKMVYMLTEGALASIQLPNGMEYTLSDAPIDGYLAPGIWHNLLITYTNDGIQLVEINGVTAQKDISNELIVAPTPLRITSKSGFIAFGDVRMKQTQLDPTSDTWNDFKYDEASLTSSGKVRWARSDAGDLVVQGTGTVAIPTPTPFSSIRFDVKFSGNGNVTVQLGELDVDLATAGDRKTGGISGHPITTNLIDQGEWCTIEIQQDESTSVLLNGITIIDSVDAPSIQGDSIQINVNDAKLSIRQIYTAD